MIIFIDTSAFYALIDADDANHRKAEKSWNAILDPEHTLLTSNYVLLECFALMQHRLGLEAVRNFQEDVLPVIGIEWVEEPVHRAGISALLAAAKRKLSLVDCVSFEIMRMVGAKTAFAFDPHFAEQGFTCIP
jgi:predicted nucleic acid-binding protein